MLTDRQAALPEHARHRSSGPRGRRPSGSRPAPVATPRAWCPPRRLHARSCVVVEDVGPSSSNTASANASTAPGSLTSSAWARPPGCDATASAFSPSMSAACTFSKHFQEQRGRAADSRSGACDHCDLPAKSTRGPYRLRPARTRWCGSCRTAWRRRAPRPRVRAASCGCRLSISDVGRASPARGRGPRRRTDDRGCRGSGRSARRNITCSGGRSARRPGWYA